MEIFGMDEKLIPQDYAEMNVYFTTKTFRKLSVMDYDTRNGGHRLHVSLARV